MNCIFKNCNFTECLLQRTRFVSCFLKPVI
ncbi:MAG: pentapeptide repeat-containing protein [Parachlamydiaceae bacterium]|nr:MAG: pentapeptide repeat-containing protein [Parachlamydiaceae bacterium]